MADIVTSQTILDGSRLFIGKYTNLSDGSGETDVVKIDVSTLIPNAAGQACNGVKINKIWAFTSGLAVNILWSAASSQLCVAIPQNTAYTMDYSSFGGIPNNAGGAGNTGDVAFTTVGATPAVGDSYTIIIECIKTATV